MAIGCHWGEFAVATLSPILQVLLYVGITCVSSLYTGIARTCGTLDWKVLWSRGTRGRGTLRM